jgi:hypothetical protein
MANAIYDGKIKEFEPKVAYFIYKRCRRENLFYVFDEPEYSSIPCINLATCLMYGEGCDQNDAAAYCIFDEALFFLEAEKKRGVPSAEERITEVKQKLMLLTQNLLESNDLELEGYDAWYETEEDFIR